jgi:3-deoxy-manno-octulosonate cytidylyltransferase (CMP-KDO synthetase)
MEIKFAAIIPARYASTRFPGKPLVQISGKTMIQRVYNQVSKVLDMVYVATDDKRIYDEVIRFGGNVIMTAENHQSGTDRCYEACTKISQDVDVIINIQGDEPFIKPEQIQTLMGCFTEEDVQIATLVRKVTQDDGMKYLQNPNHPKVVVNQQHEAIYFSRAVIPFLRNHPSDEYLEYHDYYTHVGVYAYRTKVLKELVSLQASSLEKAESLEQLRWIENGYRIHVGYTNEKSIGIDTPDDLKGIEKFI